jgi:hypothetical protein
LSLESEVAGKTVVRFVDFDVHQYELFAVSIDVQCPFNVTDTVELTVNILEDSRKKPPCFFLMTNKVRILKGK